MEGHCYFAKDREVIVSDVPSPDFIFAHPEKLGLTKEILASRYEHFGEEYEADGQAILTIILDLTRDGWVIVDKLPETACWLLLFGSLEKDKYTIYHILDEIHGKKEIGLDDPIQALGLDDGFQYEADETGFMGFMAHIFSDGKVRMKLDAEGKPGLYEA